VLKTCTCNHVISDVVVVLRDGCVSALNAELHKRKGMNRGGNQNCEVTHGPSGIKCSVMCTCVEVRSYLIPQVFKLYG
jgi:hypothetical protein